VQLAGDNKQVELRENVTVAQGRPAYADSPQLRR
jgi:hypothetical protein